MGRTEIKSFQFKKKKLKDVYIQVIQKWATDKVTSLMSSRTISYKINSLLKKKNEVDNKGRPLSIHYITVNNYLKQYFWKPRKIRKLFFYQKNKKNKRYEFCKTIIEKELKPEQIFFTDESKVELGSFTNDMIRLNPEKKNLMKKHIISLKERLKNLKNP